MLNSNYSDICALFANQCRICNGSRYIVKNGIECMCSCQMRATIKWKFEQIDVPISLKYKNWKDFTGLVGDNKIIGALTLDSLCSARNAALMYCFGSTNNNVIDDRRKYLRVHEHLSDGQNIVIVGDQHSGKTLLCTLILKEVAWASVLFNKNIDFKFIHFLDLVQAATWGDGSGNMSSSKAIDYQYLSNVEQVHFLAIDNIDVLLRGHNMPPDHVQMDSFFLNRKNNCLPTIFSCTSMFMKRISANIGEARQKYGSGFVDAFLKNDNVIINLILDKTRESVG